MRRRVTAVVTSPSPPRPVFAYFSGFVKVIGECVVVVVGLRWSDHRPTRVVAEKFSCHFSVWMKGSGGGGGLVFVPLIDRIDSSFHHLLLLLFFIKIFMCLLKE